MTVTVPPTRQTPRITFSALTQLMGGTTPAETLNIIHQQKYPAPGPVHGYRVARAQIIAHAINGAALAPTACTREYEREVIEAVVANGLPATIQGAQRPGRGPTWNYQGIEISFYPDMTINGHVGNRAGNGAVKLYMRREPISATVARSMAALLHHYQSVVIADPSALPGLCVIYDVQSDLEYVATGNTTRALQRAAQACQLVNMLWPGV